MIKEIPNPLETIFDFAAKKRASRRVKKKLNTNLTEYDVFFNEDRALIEEFSKRANIPFDYAERIAIVLFEEIKKNLINGHVIDIRGFGRFYISGPAYNHKHEVIITENSPKLVPKFKALHKLRRRLLKSGDGGE